MSGYNANIDHYRKSSVSGATPLQLVIMLYDGALRFLKQAQRAIQQDDLYHKNENLTKAQRIVAELLSCLDMEKGGEIAKNLFALYSYVYDQMVQANLNDDLEAIERSVKVLSDLRTSWVQLEEQAKSKASATLDGFSEQAA